MAQGTTVTALAAHNYTDASVYAVEKSKIFYRTWQFACHGSQVAAPGDYLSFDICDQSLFVIRDQDGTLRAFHNVCMHRAHQLVQGAGNKRSLSCPYHAWTYALDGRLSRAPSMEKVRGFDASKICLAEVCIEEFLGFIFVNLDPRAEPMSEWYPGAKEELAAFVPDIERLQPVKWVQVEEKCNWKVTVENYSECYHCRLNHKTFVEGVVDPDTYNVMPRGHCLRHTTQSANLERLSYTIDPDANEHATDYSSWFLWPTLSFQVYPGNVLNTYHWRAMGVEQTEAIRGWYTVAGAPSNVISKLASQDLETTVAEDIRLVESVQRGLRSVGYRPGPLILDPEFGVNSEHSIHALYQWREACLNRD